MVKTSIPYKNRFCLHLPTLDNDGNLIPREDIRRAFNEIKNKFGGYTTSSHIGYPTWFGFWRSPKGEEYLDYIYIIFVDVEDGKMDDALSFFEDFRQRYIKIFDQSEIYIVHNRIVKVD